MGEQQTIVIQPGVGIPASEIGFHFTRSGGPGGQHVNKAATQAELTFDVAASPSLTMEQKQRILSKLGSYVSQAGVLRLACQSSRSQSQNREEAVERFQTLLMAALHRPKRRRPTRPSRGSVERRLTGKRKRGEVKRQRRRGPDDGF